MSEPITYRDPGLRAVFHLVEHLASGHTIPDDSRELLKEALDACIASNFEASLFTELGVKRWGGISALRQDSLSRRDRALCRLCHGVEEWADLPAPMAAKAMVASFHRYETTRWPRERYQVAGPASQPSATWWTLLRAEASMPGEKRLSQILRREIQDGFEFPERPGTVPEKGDQI